MVWDEEICWKTFIWKIGKWWKDNIMIDVEDMGSEYCRWMELNRLSPVEDFSIGDADF
jgi:hypothetical protein